MSETLTLTGPLSTSCPLKTCRAPATIACRAAKNSTATREPHAVRIAAARRWPVNAHVGDLVLVRHRGEHVAQLVDIGVVLTVRFWRPSAQAFGAPRLLEREAVIGLAPDDARTDLPRAWLADENLKAEQARAAHLYATDPTVRAAVDAALDFSEPPAIAPGTVGALSLNGEKIADVETAEIDGHRFTVAPDIAEGRGPFDPGQDTSDLSPTTPDAPPDPWFTSDSAETTALPKGW